MATDPANALVFGAFGVIGKSICNTLERDDFAVIRTSMRGNAGDNAICVRNDVSGGLDELDELNNVEAVVWSQGKTDEDSVLSFSEDGLAAMLNANLLFVAATLRRLLDRDSLATGCRLCVVSSIWEEQTRPDRFSYTISKAASGRFSPISFGRPCRSRDTHQLGRARRCGI